MKEKTFDTRLKSNAERLARQSLSLSYSPYIEFLLYFAFCCDFGKQWKN